MHTMGYMLFRTVDHHRIPIVLTRSTWFEKILHPLFGHPEVKPYEEEIKHTIAHPDNVYQSIRDPRSTLHFYKMPTGEFASYFLVVVIKYIQEQETTVGYVSTVMINKRLPKASQLLWQRKIST